MKSSWPPLENVNETRVIVCLIKGGHLIDECLVGVSSPLSQGNSQIKRIGCSTKILKRIPKIYQVPTLWAWFKILFTPIKDEPILKQAPSPVIFLAQYPTRYCKSSHCGLFEADRPKRCKNCFLTPKRYNEYTWHKFGH